MSQKKISPKIFFINLIFLIIVFSQSLYAADTAINPKEGIQAYQEILSQFSKNKPKEENYNLDLNKLAWKNPALSVHDLNLSTDELRKLVADRIVLIMHKPRTIDVPYYGEMVRWHNARFVSAITEVPLSASKLRQLIVDNDKNNGWKDVEPFVQETAVLYQDNLNQLGLQYKIQGKLSIIRVNGNIYARNRYEENGDISSLFLTGDIGVSLGVVPVLPKSVLSPLPMANVRRWEFIAIDENRSLVSITDWAEVMNDTQLSKHMSQYDKDETKIGGLSDEDLVGPFPGVAVNMYNFKNAIIKSLRLQQTENGSLKSKTLPSEKKLAKGIVPDFKQNLPKQALERLLVNGPVIFMHPKQEIDTDYGGYPLHFVSTAYPVKANFKDMRRYSAQMNHYADYVPQLESSKIIKGTFDIPDFDKPISTIPPIDVNLKMSLGKRMKFISSFEIEYQLRYQWQRFDRMAFESIGGEIETVLGSIDWLAGSTEQQSILFYTSASDLGPNPKFPLSLSQKIPGADVASGVIVSTMAAGRQGPWIELQLEKKKLPNTPISEPKPDFDKK